jgi:hypothetical protein
MITVGFAGDGHKRNETNRKTQKEINRGRFKNDIDSVELKELPKEYLEKRKLGSDYRKVNDLPISRWRIFLILAFLAFAIYFLMFGW